LAPPLAYVMVLLTGSGEGWGHAWKPKYVEPVAVTVAAMLAATSTRPAPTWYAVYGNGFDVLISASLSWGAVQVGCSCTRIAAAPATCGVAIDVPLIVWYQPSVALPPARAARMSTP